jgi:putative RNA 2'-phosphotransferase
MQYPAWVTGARTDISKILSLVLRHKPEKLGLELDPAGWVSVESLLRGLAASATPITEAQLRDIVRESDKQRFALSEDGLRIRANQGHSVRVELGYAVASPPPMLFHGTIDRVLESIRRDGLVQGARHQSRR